MATPRGAPKRSGSSRGKWFFTGVLPIHETIPLQILDRFNGLFEVGPTVSTRGSNAQILTNWRALREVPPRYVMLLTEPTEIRPKPAFGTKDQSDFFLGPMRTGEAPRPVVANLGKSSSASNQGSWSLTKT